MFEARPLSDAVAKQLGGGTPPRQIAKYWNGSIPWASVKDFEDGGDSILSTQESITEAGLLASASNLIPAGTPLVCTRMAVGRSARAPMSLAINQDVKALTPAPGTSSDYLLKLLQLIQPRAEAAAVGSTVKGIRIRDYLAIAVPMAPNPEQVWITKILDTLDTTIRHTEAIIEKLKQVKQGLLHDLLTRGIDANGELRPPQSQALHLYKDSPLGWIPNKWDAVAVSDLAENLDGRRLPIKETERRPGICPYYGASGIIDWVESYILDGDFVLLGEDGENLVSRNLPLAFRVTGKIWVNNHAHIYEPREGVDIRFLVEVLEAKDYGPWVSGSAQPKLTQNALERIRLQRPPPHEQVEIADRLEASATRIAAERVEMLKLQRLKSGLMDDLLNGRIRVTSLLNATP